MFFGSMIKALRHFGLVLTSLSAVVILAVSLLAVETNSAHAEGFFLGIGSKGVFGGVRVGEGIGRRYHCHGRYCHRHRNRGYHSHNRGVVVYPPHTAPVYGSRRSYRAHVNWCLNRYRSYDPRTDTFQPYQGPRKPCNSPFDNR